LVEAEIEFVLVGGLAVNAWGYLRATQDIDVVPDPAPDNLAKLDELLRELGGKVAPATGRGTGMTSRRSKLPRSQMRTWIDGSRRYPFATSFPGRVATSVA